MTQPTSKSATDIFGQTIEKFLEQLKTDGISTDVIDRLRSTIVQNGTLAETTIRAALFGDDHQA